MTEKRDANGLARGSSRHALSAAERAAAEMRRTILALPRGTHLGREDDLIATFKLSRPTWRQTARLLLQEQLITVRRGVGGGYFTSRPQFGPVSEAATTYLEHAGATIEHLLTISGLLTAELVRLAAGQDEPLRRKLLETPMTLLTRTSAEPPADQVADDALLTDAFLALAGNPALELFLMIAYRFGNRDLTLRIFGDHPDRLPDWRVERVRLAQAVLDGDEEFAAALALRQSRRVAAWVRADRDKSHIV